MHELGITCLHAAVTNGALMWLGRAAEAGHVATRVGIGVVLDGHGDPDGAESWWIRAPALGDASAMTNLGFAATRGGDLDEALTWYKRRAAVGHGGAMHNLGWLKWELGDHNAYKELMLEAARLGNCHAMNDVALMYEEDGNLEMACHWFTLGAEAGSREAIESLHRLGRLGSGGDLPLRQIDSRTQTRALGTKQLRTYGRPPVAKCR